MFLLDELLRQQGIDREENTISNNILAKSLGSGRAYEEEEGEEDVDAGESAMVR